MKELLKNLENKSEVELKSLFFKMYKESKSKEAYLIVHFLEFKKMNTDFINNDIVEKLRVEIEYQGEYNE